MKGVTVRKLSFALVNTLLVVFIRVPVSLAQGNAWDLIKTWGDATATFYGGQDGIGTMVVLLQVGHVGTGNLYDTGYGLENVALSNAMLNNELSCGACYTLKCRLPESKWCYGGDITVTVTATNACPPGSEGGWCDPPKLHFDLSYPMFAKLAEGVAGVIPVNYKRVSCVKKGGVRFNMHKDGNMWFNYVLVYNVAGMGAVCGMSIKGENTDWVPMQHNWGQMWSESVPIVRQALSFRVSLCSTSETKNFYNVAPREWQFGQTFEHDNGINFNQF